MRNPASRLVFHSERHFEASPRPLAAHATSFLRPNSGFRPTSWYLITHSNRYIEAVQRGLAAVESLEVGAEMAGVRRDARSMAGSFDEQHGPLREGDETLSQAFGVEARFRSMELLRLDEVARHGSSH